LKKIKVGGMVDVSQKPETRRVARAQGVVIFSKAIFKELITQGSPKGNVFETARVAGIMAVKNTPKIIPLCHPLLIEKVAVEFKTDKKKNAVITIAEVVSSGKTGVEMEALTAVCASCLTIYDMMKWKGQDMTISGVKLLYKTGGKSGTYQKKN